MKPLYIFDLDGTLALMNHRRHHVEGEKPNWRAFYDACIHDTPNKPVVDLMGLLLISGADVWVWSGREETVRLDTEDWLVKNTALLRTELETILMMRPQGDYTPDNVLKKTWLDSMMEIDRARLVAVFDDRDKVVRMWRAEGITCFQVAEGNF